MCRSLNPQHQKRQKDSRSPKPVGIYVAPGRAKRLGLRLSFCRFCLEGFQRPTVLVTPPSEALDRRHGMNLVPVMQPLEPPDLHFLSAAIGWLGLGSVEEARMELARISPAHRHHPDVLEVQWLICAEQKHWDEALEVARGLMAKAP